MEEATSEREKVDALSPQELSRLDAYWRAANYLSVGQIYLLDNALLRESLKPAHIKPRLLGHWGTTPGLNFIYVHLNRVIKAHDLNVIYICGPGHGGPGMVANTYLEGTYSEIYPSIGQTPMECVVCSGNSHSQVEFRAMRRRKRLAPFMKAASSAMLLRTRTAPHSTT